MNAGKALFIFTTLVIALACGPAANSQGVDGVRIVSRQFTINAGGDRTIDTRRIVSRPVSVFAGNPARVRLSRVVSRPVTVFSGRSATLPTQRRIVSRAFSLAAPRVDLVVTAIEAEPPEGLPGTSFNVAWKIINFGRGTAPGAWVDRIWLSADDRIGSDVLVGDFPYNGPSLASQQEIVREATVTFPAAPGEWHVVVEVDAPGWMDDPTRDNNIRIDDRPVVVLPPVEPDLVVSDVSTVMSPDGLLAGATVDLSFTVTNVSANPTSVRDWRDSVFLTRDASLSAHLADEILLGQFDNPSVLFAGESYSRDVRFTLPDRFDGTFRFAVYADSRRAGAWRRDSVFDQPELVETNNVRFTNAFAVNLSPLQPDLVVTSIDFSSPARSSFRFGVSWVAANAGTGGTRVSTWTDRVFLVRDGAPGERLIGTLPRVGEELLPIGQGGKPELRTLSVVLPADLLDTDDYRVKVVTDVNDTVFEHGLDPTGIAREENNETVSERTLTIFFTETVDLMPVSLTVPPTLIRGATVDIAWRVENVGAPPSELSLVWDDAVFLSRDDVLDGEDIRVGGFFHGTERNNDGDLVLSDYSTSGFIRVPRDAEPGAWRILLAVDATDRVFEGFDTPEDGLGEHNNVFASPTVSLESPTADLVPEVDFDDAHRLQTRGAPSERIDFSWRVTNASAVSSASAPWRDVVYFRSVGADAEIPGVALTSATRQAPLGPGMGYVVERSIVVPRVPPGEYELVVEADVDDDVLEPDAEANNVVRWPFEVTADAADFVVAAVDAPDAPKTLEGGEAVLVSWRVENRGTRRTETNFWVDQVFLSTDTALDANDILLGSLSRGDFLDADAGYNASETFELDEELAGEFFLLVKADAFLGGQVFEVDESNNVRARKIVLNVERLAAPSLVVSDIAVAGSIISGQTLSVSWRVTNAGTGPTTTGSWFDSVYFSRDRFLDRDRDLFVGSTEYRGGILSPGDPPYDADGTFEVPFGVSGPYFVFVVADGGGEVFGEVTIDFREDALDVSLPPTSDLAVINVATDASGVLGDPAGFGWQARNVGEANVEGRWFDALYLSEDKEFDAGDRLLGTFEFTLAEALIPNEDSAAFEVVAPITGVKPGIYHAIVRSDVKNQIPEVDDNNIAASVGTIQVEANELVLDDPARSEALVPDADRYFRIETPALRTVRVSAAHESADATVEVYVRHGEIPSASQFDFRFPSTGESTQEVTIPDTLEGTYYVLTRVTGGTFGGASDAFFSARTIDFQVEEVFPGRIGDRGRVTLTIVGARFSDGDAVALERAGDGLVIPARAVRVLDSTRIEATLLMEGATNGPWDVVVLTPNRDPARKEGAVVVEPVVPPVLTVVEPAPAALREGASAGNLTIEVVNAGNVDADHVFVLGVIELAAGREVLGVAARDAELQIAARVGLSRQSALFSRVAPGQSVTTTVTARAGAAVDPAVAPEDIAVGHVAAVLTAEKLIEFQVEAAESARLAVLADGGLVSEEEREATLALARDRGRWREAWFDGLVASGLVIDADVRDFLPPVVPVPGIARCLDRTQPGREEPEFCRALADIFCEEWPLRAIEIGADALGVFAAPPLSEAIGLICSTGDLVSCEFCTFWPVKRSDDPNEKTGGEGTGGEGLLSRDRRLTYRVHFENQSTATGPASLVEIRDTLDPAINSGSFRVGDIAFADTRVDVPDDVAFFQRRVEVADSDGLLVEVTAGIDAREGEAFWVFQTLERETGLPPTDGNRGFLQPTDDSGRGLGWVEFSVIPSPQIRGRIRIKNEARIRFDANETIITNAIEHTIDGELPRTSVGALPEIVEAPEIQLIWSRDESSGDVASYTIFASTDGGPFLPFLVNTTETSGVFRGEPGRFYEFYSVGVDHAGNEEPPPSDPDAFTTIRGGDPRLRRSDANGDGGVDISDAIFILIFLFGGGASPPCLDAADANDDGALNIADPIFTLNYLFGGGREPEPPGPHECGPDPTGDALEICEDPQSVCE